MDQVPVRLNVPRLFGGLGRMGRARSTREEATTTTTTTTQKLNGAPGLILGMLFVDGSSDGCGTRVRLFWYV